MNLIDEIRSSVTGAAIIADWIGAGSAPVEDWLAETRAEICEPCHFNRSAKWWEGAKEAVAETVRQHLQMKHRLGFRVKNEDALGICSVCGCVNPLAVWSPIEHIRNHTSPDHLKAFPDQCWKRREIEGLK